MAHWLDDAIERTSGPVADFLRELREMLALVQPAALDEAACSTSPSPSGLRVTLAHAREERWSIWIDAGDDSIVVGIAEMHEHFEPWREEFKDEERAWSTQAVDFVAELLRGEIEIHTTYRGNSVAKVNHYRLEPDGSRTSFGVTGFTAAAAVWRPKRTEVERVSFDARG